MIPGENYIQNYSRPVVAWNIFNMDLDNMEDSKGHDLEIVRESFMEKLKRFLRYITVEPMVFVYTFSWYLQWPAEYAFLYDRLCYKRFDNDEICENLHKENHTQQEDLIQSDTSYFLVPANLCSQIPPIVLIILFGVISDNYSKKLVMIIPLVGHFMESFIYLLMAEIPSIPLEIFYLGKLLLGFGGCWANLFLGCHSYVTFLSKNGAETSIRIALVNAMWTIGLASTYFIGGIVLDKTTYVFIFAFSFGLHVLETVYVVMFITDMTPTTDNMAVKTRRCSLLIQAFVHLKEGAKTIIKNRPNRARVHLILTFVLMMGILLGFGRKFSFKL